ncbi:MAG: hypothetical protein Q4F61_03395, partial [Candidatus Saccharibacteria bacterium]|nr:hypothetical protein [Candidatus Saccharibacteria bacterium]
MYGAPHRIEIRKNNKDVKMLLLNTPDETEGLFVDGNTGVIYFTTIHVDNKNKKQLWIYKITDYRLPPPTKKKTNSSKKSAANNNASNSNNSQSSNSKSKNGNSGQSPSRNTKDGSKSSQNNSSTSEANND